MQWFRQLFAPKKKMTAAAAVKRLGADIQNLSHAIRTQCALIENVQRQIDVELSNISAQSERLQSIADDLQDRVKVLENRYKVELQASQEELAIHRDVLTPALVQANKLVQETFEADTAIQARRKGLQSPQ